MNAIVIGAGVIGCATAWELQKVGYAVTVLEKNGDAGHGSTSASCGIVRRFYAQPGMIALAHEGAQVYADWGNHIGPIDDALAEFVRPGMLFIPPEIDDSVRATVAEMQKLGVDVAILSVEELTQRFPFIATDSFFPPTPVDDPGFFDESDRSIQGAVFEADAGYVVFPALAAQNLRMAAQRDGVSFRFRSRVTAIEPGGASRFRLTLDGGKSLDADVVVNVSGPHSSVTNKMAGVELPLETRPLRREVHAVANPLAQGDEGDGGTTPIVGDLDGGIYFRPESGGRDVIVGSTDPTCDVFDFVADPDDFDRDVTQAYRQRQTLRLMKRFPTITQGPARGVADLYDVTVQDWYPIVDRTQLPGYYVCIGTSGSSFKTAPVLGRLVAEMVRANESGQDTDVAPLQFALPHIGVTVDTGFLSRHRGKIETSGTVIG